MKHCSPRFKQSRRTPMCECSIEAPPAKQIQIVDQEFRFWCADALKYDKVQITDERGGMIGKGHLMAVPSRCETEGGGLSAGKLVRRKGVCEQRHPDVARSGTRARPKGHPNGSSFLDRPAAKSRRSDTG